MTKAEQKAAKKAQAKAEKKARVVIGVEPRTQLVPPDQVDAPGSIVDAPEPVEVIDAIVEPVDSPETPFSLGEDVGPSADDYFQGDGDDLGKAAYDAELARAKDILRDGFHVAKEPAIEPAKPPVPVHSAPSNGDVVMTMSGAIIRRG